MARLWEESKDQVEWETAEFVVEARERAELIINRVRDNIRKGIKESSEILAEARRRLEQTIALAEHELEHPAAGEPALPNPVGEEETEAEAGSGSPADDSDDTRPY
jgi:hypothetical protein